MISLIFIVLQGSTLAGCCVLQLCILCDKTNSGSFKTGIYIHTYIHTQKAMVIYLVHIAQDLTMEASSHSRSVKLLFYFSCISHVEKENRKRYEESSRLPVLETEINTASQK